MPLLSLDHVSAGYGEAGSVLLDVSLQLERGEQVAVIGGNGEGKTTLLKVAAGLLKPRRGTCVYTGESNPAFIYQVPSQQLICASAREEVEFTLRINGVDESLVESRAEELLSEFQLTAFASRSPRTLSGGQQQRLTLAATLCRSPELLLLDEPDAFLDCASRREFRSFFSQHVRAAVIWVVCRESELPQDMRVYRLKNGVMSS